MLSIDLVTILEKLNDKTFFFLLDTTSCNFAVIEQEEKYHFIICCEQEQKKTKIGYEKKIYISRCYQWIQPKSNWSVEEEEKV